MDIEIILDPNLTPEQVAEIAVAAEKGARTLRRKPRGGRRRSYAEVAGILDHEGLPPRFGDRWNSRALRNILTR